MEGSKYGVPRKLSDGKINPEYSRLASEASRRTRGINPRKKAGDNPYGISRRLPSGERNPEYNRQYYLVNRDNLMEYARQQRRAKGMRPQQPSIYGADVRSKLPNGKSNLEYERRRRRAHGIKPMQNTHGVPKSLPNGKQNPEYWAVRPERNWAIHSRISHSSSGNDVNLSIDYLERLAKETKICPIHGDTLDYSPNKGFKDLRKTPSLDRINNELWLGETNVWIICKFSNMMKATMTLEEWIDFSRQIFINREEISMKANRQKNFLVYSEIRWEPRNFKDGRQKRVWAGSSIYGHRRKGYIVTVSLDRLAALALCVSHCPICGSELDYRRGIGHKPLRNSPSTDIIDGTHNMTPENIWIICRRCNMVKQALGLEEFIVECENVFSKKQVLSELTNRYRNLKS